MRTAPLLMWTGITVVGMVLAFGSWAPNSASGIQQPDGAPDAKLAERVTALERAVLSDPLRPRSTVLARLDAIEKTLEEAARKDTRESRTEARTDERAARELTESLEKLRKENAELTRRLQAIEQQLDRRPSPGPDLAAEVRTLDREVNEARRTADEARRGVDDLRTRVTRLEARR